MFTAAGGGLLIPTAIFSIASLLNAQNCASPPSGNPCVLTGQNDNNRDGYNSNETALTSSTVTTTSVTQLFQFSVDTNDLPATALANPIYAQPLYVAQVPSVGSPSATHDLLIGVTLNGSAFAWDGENQACKGTSPICWSRQGKQTGGLLWFDDCAPDAVGPVPLAAGLPYSGIVATPVIDTTLSPPAIFLTSYCLDSGFNAHWYLHKLTLADGTDLTGSPIQVQIGTGPAGVRTKKTRSS